MNATTFGILSIVCQLGVALDPENGGSAGLFLMASPLLDTSAGFESPVNQGEGGNYEKPVGQCRLSPASTVIGCKCTTRDLLSALSPPKVDASVCADDCESTGDCPAPPKGTQRCLQFPQVCVMNCKENSDCLEGGSCINLAKYGGQGHACMFEE